MLQPSHEHRTPSCLFQYLQFVAKKRLNFVHIASSPLLRSSPVCASHARKIPLSIAHPTASFSIKRYPRSIILFIAIRRASLIHIIVDHRSSTSVMYPRLSSTTSFRLLKWSSLNQLHCSTRRSSSLGPVQQKTQGLGRRFRLVLAIDRDSSPQLTSLREQMSLAQGSVWIEKFHNELQLLQYLPAQYASLYPTMVQGICKNQHRFEVGNGFLFQYTNRPGLGIRLSPPREVIDICNKVLMELPERVDNGKPRVPDWLYLPLFKTGSPEATTGLLATLKEAHPDGIPMGRACGLVLKLHGHKDLIIQSVAFTGAS